MPLKPTKTEQTQKVVLRFLRCVLSLVDGSSLKEAMVWPKKHESSTFEKVRFEG